jgi:integrase/recombinase XerD
VSLAIASRVGIDFDPLLDKSYEGTALGPDVVDWLAWLDMAGRAERTLDTYERDLSYLCHMYPSKTVGEFTDGDLSHVVRSWSKPQRGTRKAALDSFFGWAVRQQRIDRNPMAPLPRIQRHGQRWYDIFTEAEVDDFLALPLVDSSLLAILIEAGLRKSEAIGLQVRRLNLDARELVVVGGKGDKDRVIPMSLRLHDSLADLLLFECMDAMDYLWYTKPGGGPVRRSRALGDGSFDRWWRRVVRETGVRYRNPHMTRHTFATRWLRRGGRLTTLSGVMGHASIKTTFDLYGHLDVRDAAADLAMMEAGGRL